MKRVFRDFFENGFLRWKRSPGMALVLGVLLIILGGWGLKVVKETREFNAEANRILAGEKGLSTPIAQMPELAELNLLCSLGVDGVDRGVLENELQVMEGWVSRVRSETERFASLFDKDPVKYRGSRAYFRMMMLVTVLQEDCGVRYNPKRMTEIDYREAKDVFIHGLLDSSSRMGTCVSMPVLYVAIGRRLGYPLRLVTTRGHLFARWEDEKTGERFNVEATNQGMNSYGDDHYKRWPEVLSEEEIASEGYLRSLTPQEELSLFLSIRGQVLDALGRLEEGKRAHLRAYFISPGIRQFEVRAERALDRERNAFYSGVKSPAVEGLRMNGVVADLPQIPSISDLSPVEGKSNRCGKKDFLVKTTKDGLSN